MKFQALSVNSSINISQAIKLGDQRRCDGGVVGNDGWGEEEREERVCVRERETDRQTDGDREEKERNNRK